jgi:hypothetical protein
VTFTNAIAPVPLCCPARASLLTGRDPQNHGVLSNEAATGGGFDGLDQSDTVARWLHDAGYRTAHIGKYMNGYGPRSAIPPGWDEWWATSVNPFLMYDYTLNHDGQEEHFGFAPEDYKTDVLTRLATGFVRDATPQAQPFYLQLWYTAPHAELGTDIRGATYKDAPRPAPRHLDRYASARFARLELQRSGCLDKPEGPGARPGNGVEHHLELPQSPGQPGRRGRGSVRWSAVDAARAPATCSSSRRTTVRGASTDFREVRRLRPDLSTRLASFRPGRP